MIEVMPISDDDGMESTRCTRSQLIAVIRQRLDGLFGEVGRRLDDMGFSGPAGHQVVLTGGCAELKSITDFAQGVLGRSVRLGRPRGLTGLPEAQSGPAFSTLAGLGLHAASGSENIMNLGNLGKGRSRAEPEARGAFGRMVQLLRASI